MKQFILGIFMGSLIASAIWWFIIKKQDEDDRQDLRNLITALQQREMQKETAERALDEKGLSLLGEKSFTIIAAEPEGYYYFTGSDCSKIKKGVLVEVAFDLQKAKQQYGDELMVTIKQSGSNQTDQLKDLVRELDRSGLKAGQFSSLMLTNAEKDCIESIEKNK
jgi:hypothetical protein